MKLLKAKAVMDLEEEEKMHTKSLKKDVSFASLFLDFPARTVYKPWYGGPKEKLCVTW